jgi:hypothetical protein
MIKRRFKLFVSLFLVALMGLGLTVSTLHSHHHLEWHQSTDFAETEHCISKDTTVCPISGYIFETEILSTSHSGKIFFSVEKIITGKDFQINDYSTFIIRGRSPPVLG